jgi:hypothetical protein
MIQDTDDDDGKSQKSRSGKRKELRVCQYVSCGTKVVIDPSRPDFNAADEVFCSQEHKQAEKKRREAVAASTSVPKSFGPSGTDGTSGWTPGLPNPKGVAQSKGAVDPLSFPFPKTPAEPKAKAEPKANAWAEYAGVKPGNTAKLVTKIESPFPPVPPFPKGAAHFDDPLLHPKTKSKDELFVAGEYYTGKSYLLPGVVEGIVKTGRDEISRLQGPAGLPMGIPAVRPVLASRLIVTLLEIRF